MGLFDRLLSFGSGSGSAQSGTPASKPKPKKAAEAVYLDPDESSSMGNVNFMRRSNTIRRTFPGSASSPGQKEMVAEVDSMQARIEKASEGLGDAQTAAKARGLNDGVPKPVKKTFAQQMSQAELMQRQKGNAVNPVNQPAAAKPAPATPAAQPQSQPSSLDSAKPGTIDPFRQMVKDVTS